MAGSWEINGIRGKGQLPAIAGSFSGPLVIMGSARCLWDDLAQLQAADVDYMAINATGLFALKPIKHWASKHPYGFPHWLGLYMQGHFPTDSENPDWNFFAHLFKPHVYTHGPEDAEVNWDFETATDGSSSMFGVLAALALGYAPVYLAGIPLDGSGSFYDPPGFRTLDYGTYHEAWNRKAGLFKGRVKSFSGFTRELLGAP